MAVSYLVQIGVPPNIAVVAPMQIALSMRVEAHRQQSEVGCSCLLQLCIGNLAEYVQSDC